MSSSGSSSSKSQFKDEHEPAYAFKRRKYSDESDTDKICLLLEDMNLQCAPEHLRVLLEHFEDKKLSQAEILFLLIYVIALECGYVARNVYDKHYRALSPVSAISCFHAQNVRLLARQPPAYDFDVDNGVYRLQIRSTFAPKTSQNEERPDQKMQLLKSCLTGITTGDLFLVTLSPEPAGNDRGYSVYLSINRFVLGPQKKTKPLYKRLQKMNELSLLLRQNLFNPMRIQQLGQLEPQVCPTLVGLPPELYDGIFKHLTENQMNIVANVNRHLNAMTNFSRYRPKKRQ